MKDLPKFKPRPHDYVLKFAKETLTKGETTYFHNLTTHQDGHYRVTFDAAYFGDQEPTKSQWSTLKKRMKRHNDQVFVFKEHGMMGDGHYYVDFGFFAD